jgi:hypothetical protein
VVFFADGNSQALFCIPGPTWGESDPYLPKEVVKGGDGRERTRIWCDKTEAGHTLLRDDNGKKEGMFLCDWTGAGWFSRCPGKEEDDDEEACGESKPRKGEKRGTKSAFAGNASKPSEVIDDGMAIVGTLDLDGQGFFCVAKDGDGKVALFAGKEPGKFNPSIILDSKNNRIVLTAGSTQIQILGNAFGDDDGAIYFTKRMIWQAPLIDVKDWFKEIYGKVKDHFKRYGGDS